MDTTTRVAPWLRRARWVPRQGREDGASAVEMAIVLPVLLMLLIGVLNIGCFFYDSIAFRQAAREGARQAVVQTTPSNCSSVTGFGAQVACTTKAAAGPTIAAPLVYVPAPTGGWAQGSTLLVCVMGQEPNFGFVPQPAGGLIKTKTYMSIEVGTPPSTGTTYQDAAPAGADWSWCS